MADSYLPAEDSAALTWMQVFSSGLTANPGTYNVSAADALAVTNAYNLFLSSFNIAANPATRTPVSVATKDDARTSAEQICRQFAMMIKLNAGISDPDKIAIGIRPVNTSREPINPPGTSPLLNVIGATPGAHTLRYADSSTPDSGAKPFGASNLQLFVAIGTAATVNEDDAQFYGAFTKNAVGVLFDSADDGKVATYFARWSNRRGEVGPWSLPVSMRIAA